MALRFLKIKKTLVYELQLVNAPQLTWHKLYRNFENLENFTKSSAFTYLITVFCMYKSLWTATLGLTFFYINRIFCNTKISKSKLRISPYFIYGSVLGSKQKHCVSQMVWIFSVWTKAVLQVENLWNY